MSVSRKGKENLPGWTVIGSEEDLERHDPHASAYILVPPALVRPIWEWFQHLKIPGDSGEWARGIELFLCCRTEGDRLGMASALNQVQETIRRLYAIVHRYVAQERPNRPRSPAFTGLVNGALPLGSLEDEEEVACGEAQ